MEYIKKYDLIVTALRDFENKGCQFYLSLLSYNCAQPIQDPLKQLIFDKGKRLDVLTGMSAVSAFLLDDSRTKPDYDCHDLVSWLDTYQPLIYDALAAGRIAGAHSPVRALKIIIELESQAIDFYKLTRKRITMNTVEIDSMISQQKRGIEKLRYTMDKMPVEQAPVTPDKHQHQGEPTYSACG